MKIIAKKSILFLFVVGLLTAFDQWTKHLAVVHLKGQSPYVIWKNVFELHYAENTGAAFSIMEGRQYLFVMFTLLICLIFLFLYYRLPFTRYYRKLSIMLLFVLSGAFGNLIDRVRQGYVVDFFYFKLIDFPIFNMADIYVTVTMVFLLIFLLFYYKDEDFSFLHKKNRREEDSADGPSES